MKKLISLIVLVAVVAAIAVGLAEYGYSRHQIAFERAPVTVQVKPGDSPRAIGATLREAGIQMPRHAMSLAARYRKDARKIQAGTYSLAPPLTLAELLDKMVAGDVMSTKVQFIEGWRFAQIREAIARNKALKRDTTGMSEAEILKKIGATETKAEGLFFPSTYQANVGASDLDIYRQSYEKMRQVLNKAWQEREENLPLKTPYDALRLASIVEKETGIESDRTIIAGVFINRLRINMMLQSDPTTIYGLGDSFDGDLKRKHLRTDTPFNTYTRKGLTPTPIASPSEASILAVLHPAKTKAIYFVARGDGSSQFSQTLKEHEAAVRKYQLKK
jgi:UPF0755 protein